MKTKRIVLAVLLAFAFVGGAVIGVLPTTVFSQTANAKATTAITEQADNTLVSAAAQGIATADSAIATTATTKNVATIAATSSKARQNPAKNEDITTYDVYKTEDFRYNQLNNGNLQVAGFSETGYNKAVEAINQRGMFSMSMPKDKKVTSVATKAFYYTTALRAEVEKLYIPANITEISTLAFHYFENMSQLFFEDGTQDLTLSSQSFLGVCSLKDLYIPARVNISWGSITNPFAFARDLEHIYVHPDNSKLTSRDSMGNEVDAIMAYQPYANVLYTGCKNTKIVSGISILQEQAFQYNQTKSIILPSSVKELRTGALAGTRVRTLVLPENLQRIGQGMFADCSDLVSIVLPHGDFDFVVFDNNLDWQFENTYALQSIVAENKAKAAYWTEQLREYGHLVTYEIEIVYHFLDGHVETAKKLYSRDLSWTLQEDGSWDVGTYQLPAGTWADAAGNELSYDDVNGLVCSGEVTSALNLYQTKEKDEENPDPDDPNKPVDPDNPDDPNKPDKPVDPDNPDNPDDGKVEGQGSGSGNGVAKNLWWIIPLVIVAIALLVWAAFAVVAAITGVAGIAGFAALFAMIFKHKNDEDDWLKRVLKIIRKKV